MAKVIRLIGKHPYEVADSQQLVEGGNVMRLVRGAARPIRVGEAYTCFTCKKSQEEVQSVVEDVATLPHHPSELELSLVWDAPPQLRRHARDEIGIIPNYVLHAYYPTATNVQTARALADVFNQMYQSSLYHAGEPSHASTWYKIERFYNRLK